jgi:purine-binding chemotaxis protein CheW
MERQLVIFDLANEHYAVDIAAVDSIIEIQSITAVPRAPQFIEGITNLRGVVLPVIDLRKRFGLEVQETTRKTRIVVVEMDSMAVGLIVDAVTEVIRIPEDAIEPLSPIVTTVDSTFITGVAKVDERLIILLDLNKVLSTEDKADIKTMQPVEDEIAIGEE